MTDVGPTLTVQSGMGKEKPHFSRGGGTPVLGGYL